MRVNIISSFGNHTGLSQDVLILRGIIAGVFGKETEIRTVPHVYPHCEEAEINFFLEVINPSLFSYARRNIWIPNLEWTYKTWEPYLRMVDEIWVKTHEAEEKLNSMDIKCKYIGWTSIDKIYADKVNYSNAFLPIGKNIFRNPRPVFQAYLKIKNESEDTYLKLPMLHVQYNPNHIDIKFPPAISDKVVLHDRELKESEYDELMKSCGLCICISMAEGFGHAVNECMAVGMNTILSSIPAFKELTSGDGLFGNVLEKIDQPDCFGTLVDTTSDSLVDALKVYVTNPFRIKRAASDMMRGLFEARHKEWVVKMKEVLEPLKDIASYALKDVFPKEDDLPDVSIVTITKDRRAFMPLAKYCYLLQSYPADKLEWVIVDDGESIEDTLFGIPNVTYVRCEPGMTVSQKRNFAVSKCMYDTIVMMDDDDVYPENSVLHRVAMMMKEPAKECGFCTTIPCYDITKYSSFMNVPPMTLPMSERVSEATLIFTKKFWEEGGFDDMIKVGEGDAFISGREQMCREISPQEVIVSLVHPKNMSSRKCPEMEPNGCHYGFNEKLFALVSDIGEDLKALNTSGQTETSCPAESCETCPPADAGDHPQPQQPSPPPSQ